MVQPLAQPAAAIPKVTFQADYGDVTNRERDNLQCLHTSLDQFDAELAITRMELTTLQKHVRGVSESSFALVLDIPDVTNMHAELLRMNDCSFPIADVISHIVLADALAQPDSASLNRNGVPSSRNTAYRFRYHHLKQSPSHVENNQCIITENLVVDLMLGACGLGFLKPTIMARS